MKLLGKTRSGGNIIEIPVPLEINDLYAEIADKLRQREMTQHEAEQVVLAKIEPFIKRALGPYQRDLIRDVLCLTVEKSVSSLATLPRRKLIGPSKVKLCKPSPRETLAAVSSRGRRLSGIKKRAGAARAR